jgi:hypothetical protein
LSKRADSSASGMVARATGKTGMDLDDIAHCFASICCSALDLLGLFDKGAYP